MTLLDVLSATALEVAPLLLGRRLTTRVDGEVTTVELTEVEAYMGPDDPASHAYRGRTKRNAAMFEGPGTLYVYRSYGIHWCMNVTVGPVGQPMAVLLRGGRVVAGAGTVTRRRRREEHLTDGPGKLCQAMAVDGRHDGTSVVAGPVRLSEERRASGEVCATPRIGISKAVDYPWRFVLRD